MRRETSPDPNETIAERYARVGAGRNYAAALAFLRLPARLIDLGQACEANGLAGFDDQGQMWFQPPGDLIAEQTEARIRAALTPDETAGLEAGEAMATWAWLAVRRNLQLGWHGPVYGDDDDQTQEWRVWRESGPINDREWDLVGVGDTALAAVISARATIDAEAAGRRPKAPEAATPDDPEGP